MPCKDILTPKSSQQVLGLAHTFSDLFWWRSWPLPHFAAEAELDSSTSVFSGTRIRPCEKSIPAPPDTKKSVVRLHYFFKRAAVLSAEYQGLVIAKGETDKTDRIFAVLIERRKEWEMAWEKKAKTHFSLEHLNRGDMVRPMERFKSFRPRMIGCSSCFSY